MEKSISIVHISENPWEKRWSAAEQFLKPLGINVTSNYVKSSADAFETDFLTASKSLPDVLVIDEVFGEQTVELISHTTQETDLVGAILLLTKKNNQLWPRVFYEDALVSAISKEIGQLDLMAPALVAGAGAEVRFIILSLMKVGFNKISVTDENSDRGIRLVEELKKKFFNVEIKFVKSENITTLPGVYSLVLNTTELSMENQILDELYFFNFLKTNAAVADLSLVPPLTPLLTEAQEWGARLLSGDSFYSFYDTLIFKDVLGLSFSGDSIDKYRHLLGETARSVSFDLDPYLKRFMDRV